MALNGEWSRERESDARSRAKHLMQQREELEREMDAISARLSSEDMPGESGPLTDSEGFPLAGLDLYAIRRDRKRLRELHNDYTQLSNELASCLSSALSPSHSSFPQQPSAPPPQTTTRPPDSPTVSPPIAAIGSVAANSPASAAGLREGDKLISLGRAGAGSALRDLAAAIRACENTTVTARVLRHGQEIDVSLTPQRWEGDGILGCELQAIS